MVLTAFDPFTADFDRLVRRTFGWSDSDRQVWTSALAMDVIRRDDEVVLRLDLPGADPDSIELTTDHGVLTVTAKRDEEYAQGERPVRRERVMGSFTRKIRLAETVDAEKIEAAYDNGVLTVTLPLAEAVKPRKIEIKRAETPELAA
jgi:HSP20 family protein